MARPGRAALRTPARPVPARTSATVTALAAGTGKAVPC